MIVDEKRHKLYGKNVEDLGWYNPRTDKYEFRKERVEYWLKQGVKSTDTVHNLLVSAGIVSGKKIAVHKSRRTDSKDKEKEVGTPTEASEQPKKEPSA